MATENLEDFTFELDARLSKPLSPEPPAVAAFWVGTICYCLDDWGKGRGNAVVCQTQFDLIHPR